MWVVPLTYHYLDVTDYGIWLTLTSILTWISLFDIGLGNGLRNKLAEAIALKNEKLGQVYVSTTVALLCIIMGGFWLLVLVINPFLDWSLILNTSPDRAESLSVLVVIVFTFFCLQFILKFIGIVLLADQRSAANDLLGVLGSFLSLVIIFILTRTTEGSLNYVAVAFSAAPVFVLLLSYPLLFRGRYKHLKPRYSCVKLKYSKDLMGLGIQFFILQISGLVVFTTTNMIITQLFGPAEVTPYNIVFKYFNVVVFGFNIILSPMWSAYTDAYCKGDFDWMKRGMKRMVQLWGISVLGVFLMIVLSDWVYAWWIGEEMVIDWLLTVLMGIYVIISNWNNIFAQLLAGVGKIRLSLINSVFNAVIFIPLAIYMGKGMGVNGLVFATIVVLLTSSFWQPVQCLKILNQKARGIWNR